MLDLVVIGLGYVGLPLVHEACRRGLSVSGLDLNRDVVENLQAGRSHVDDLSDGDIQGMLAAGFQATTDPASLAFTKTIVICVPTPLSPEGGPDLGAVRDSAETISKHLQPGTLVVLESTTWPGTTEEVVKPILESSGLTVGEDFNLAFSPERIDPGNEKFNLRNTPKVVGGLTSNCTKRASDFYSGLVDTVVPAQGCGEAEMAKLLENTYRHINIALVNEMLKFSHELGINFWDVIRCASTKPFGFQAFYPGPGVGGHCIPIDPNYLSHRVRAQLGYPFRFVELAQEVNLSMPEYVATRISDLLNDRGLPLRGSKVLLLGVTYKPGIADQRESPALPLAEILLRKGCEVGYCDPFVPEWRLSRAVLKREEDLDHALRTADLVVLLQPHAEYEQDRLVSADNHVLDTRGQIHGPKITPL